MTHCSNEPGDSLIKTPATGPADRPSRFLRCALFLYDFLWFWLVAGWLGVRLVRLPGWGFRAMGDRLGFLPRRPPTAPVGVWVHAVSIGELLSARPVLTALKKRHPDWWIVLTTTQRHAYELARSQGSGADAVSWLPWDFGPCIQMALNRTQPDVLVLVECELWPNLIVRAARRGAPILMMNARIYERDLPRYLQGRRLFAPLLRMMAVIGAQSEGDYHRFLCLGAPTSSLVLSGNTKYDVAMPADWDARLAHLRSLLPLGPGPLWILASTHDNEEEQILARAHALAKRFPGLQFLIAPRHIDRAEEICKLAERLGWRPVLRSRSEPGNQADVIILDTIGELAFVLGLADLVFVGGSLVDKGGHNPIEAGWHGKATLMGPSFYNFADIVAAFRAEQAVVVVKDADDLVAQAAGLLADVAGRQDFCRRAADVVRRHTGAADTYARQLAKLAQGSQAA